MTGANSVNSALIEELRAEMRDAPMAPILPGPPPSLRPAFTVWAVGAKVKVGGDIPAVVLGFAVEGQAIRYRVEWWDNRDRHVEWLPEDSLSGEPGEPTASVIFGGNAR
jgi:hypothetical protein